MKKRMFTLFLTLCLTMSLLPVAAMADPILASVTVGDQTLKLTDYNTPVYSVNTPAEVLDTEGNKFTAIGQAITTDAENWNAMLVWNVGDKHPILYLKGFKFDEYNAETGMWKARYQSTVDRNDPNKKGADTIGSGITIPAGSPVNIVITGEDSLIRTCFGITYKSDLNIKSEGNAKLTIHNKSSAITSESAKNCALTIDADLDLSVESFYNRDYSHILQTNQADLTINGGNIRIDTPSDLSLCGIITRTSGNIIINDGNITANSSIGRSVNNGTIHSNGQIIVNGGNLNITAKRAMPMYAKNGIIINGGKTNLTGPFYGINAGTDDSPADVTVNGGTLKIIAERAFWKYPVLGSNIVVAYAGENEEIAEVYDVSNPTLAKKPWMILSDDPNNKPTGYIRSATVINTSGANVWSKPYTTIGPNPAGIPNDSVRVYTAAYKSKLNVVGKLINYSGGLWYKLSDGNWVYSANIRVTDYNPADVETYNKTFVVTSWGANIWSKPYSSGDSKVVKTVAKAANLSIVAKVRNSTGGLWYQLSDGGWVYSNNVIEKSYEPSNVIAYNRSATVMATAGANIWSEPSTSGLSKLVRTAKYQAKLTVVGKITNNAGSLWYKLSDGNWVYSNNIRVTDYNTADVETCKKTFVVTSWGANIWSKPYSSGDSKVVKTVAKAADLSIVAKVRNSTYGLWYQLSDGGWVYSNNVKEKTDVSYNTADVMTHKATYVVTAWSANVWSKPYSSGDSKLAKIVSKGETLSVVAKVTNSSSGLWYKLSDGNWIYSANVTMQ